MVGLCIAHEGIFHTDAEYSSWSSTFHLANQVTTFPLILWYHCIRSWEPGPDAAEQYLRELIKWIRGQVECAPAVVSCCGCQDESNFKREKAPSKIKSNVRFLEILWLVYTTEYAIISETSPNCELSLSYSNKTNWNNPTFQPKDCSHLTIVRVVWQMKQTIIWCGKTPRKLKTKSVFYSVVCFAKIETWTTLLEVECCILFSANKCVIFA